MAGKMFVRLHARSTVRAILAVSLISIAGCNKTVSEMNYAEVHQLANEIRARCAAQAGPPGSQQYEACTQIEARHETLSRERKRAAVRGAAASLGEGLSAAGASYTAASQRYVYCSSQQYGQMGTISCQ
jgi:hypothetical protein